MDKPPPQPDPAAKDIFLAALDHSPAAWEGFVRQQCGGDPHRLDEVRRLLAAYTAAQGAGFLEDGRDLEIQPGAMLGAYRLDEAIGEGGFGRVFLATQTEPIQRRVAVKVLKPGMDSGQVLARFEAERQALARMDHPAIARILDAGATPSGRPWFVMEYVAGEPITAYCDRRRLTIPERVALFEQVCFAVHHAHTKGVLHRDLKPGNLLVTELEGRPLPKVIDFGIAKALETPLTERTLETAAQQMLGTPQYMSPEQARAEEGDVDTRSDIYSLGVLLYELLTGTTPLTGDALHKARGNLRQVLGRQQPQRPSQRVRSLDPAACAQLRSCTPAELLRTLRGDLDWIALMALEAERHRRYDAAAALARDVRRHLEDRPVRARRPSTGYLLRKFVRRHRVGAAAIAAVTGALLAGLVLATLAQREAGRERDRARAQLRDLHLAQARAHRLGDQPGRRAAGLAAVRNAAAIRSGTDLRDEAIALLGLQDLERERSIPDLEPVAMVGPRHHRLVAHWAVDQPPKERGLAIHRLPDPGTAAGERGQRVALLQGVPASPQRTVFSPRGSHVALSLPGDRAQVWHIDSGSLLLDLPAGSFQPHGIAFDPSADPPGWVAVARKDGSLQVMGLPDGALLRTWTTDPGPDPVHLAAAPDGQRLALAQGGERPTLSFFHLASPGDHDPETLQVAAPAMLHGLAWHPDGQRLAAAGDDDSVYVLWARTGTVQRRLVGHQGAVVRVAWHPDGHTLASGAWDNTVRVWRARDGAPLVGPLVEHRLLGFATSLITASRGAVHLWGLATGNELRRGALAGHMGGPAKVAFSGDSRWIATAGANGVHLWDGVTATPCLEALDAPARGALFLNDDAWLVVAAGERLLRFGVRDPGGVIQLTAPHELWSGGEIRGLCAGPGGTSLLATTDGSLLHLDATDGRELRRLPGFAGMTTPPRISPDGRFVFTGCWKGEPGRVWDYGSGAVLQEFPGIHVRGGFSPDGRWLCIGGARSHRLLEVGSWRQVLNLPRLHPDDLAGAVDFSPDGTLLALGTSRYRISLVDVPGGEVLARIENPDHIATIHLAFSPDGRRLALLSPTQHLLVWDLHAVRQQLRGMGLDWSGR